jgi:hypothetical protein
MKLNAKDVNFYLAAQARAWACYFIWRAYSVEPFVTITGFLGYLLFMVLTEYFWYVAKGVFIRREQ